ncbi:hypothetical protein CAPTEDRAFT_185839 [Capitella teleta]|uniref:Calpain catalytic domain-containing protein n=1 Tax=Capitella teleta TaxID=283909 RepID=R7V915_CAPTE|nr:hypothetical protein CAPTEDRAFT_185839 [Capitella teleta]|eukprot:ELU15007.1 hypothetical protein CAPTEDRAFT_185839 [Capitella teleta]
MEHLDAKCGFQIEYRGSVKAMIRIRNPWGSRKGEWLGDWSDSSVLWDEVTDDVKTKMKVSERQDGEFWMALEDYVAYFNDTHMCNFTPDFDKDGKEGGLNQLCCILGEWRAESAAGCDPDVKMDNQKYLFSVPKKGLDEEGKLPVVLQVLQFKEHIKSKEPPFYMRTDLYKIVSQDRKGHSIHLVLDEITNFLNYFGGSDYAYRYRLLPGDYMIVPTTLEPGQEKAFCLRLFSSVPIKCRELSSKPAVYVRKAEPTFSQNGHKFQLGKKRNRILSANDSTPLDANTIYRAYEQCLSDIEGANPFIIGYEAHAYYMVPPGDYIIICFTNDPDVAKDFALAVATRRGINTQLKQRYGFIRFCTLMKAMNAIQMRTNFTLAGKRIHLDFGSLSFLQLANDILEANPINFLLPGELGVTENKSANVSRYLGVVPRSCNVTLKEVQAIFIKYGLILVRSLLFAVHGCEMFPRRISL